MVFLRLLFSRPFMGALMTSQEVAILDSERVIGIIRLPQAGIAQLVERNLAKVEVAGSNPVSRSSLRAARLFSLIVMILRQGSQVVRQRSAKPLFAGSIPAPASSL